MRKVLIQNTQPIVPKFRRRLSKNNNGKEAAVFRGNLERDVIDCFLRGLKPELEIRIGRADKFEEIVKRAIRE